MKTLFRRHSVADIEERLKINERLIGDLRAEQAVLVHELSKMAVHRRDACRSLAEWLQSHLDISRETARALVTAGRSSAVNPGVQEDLSAVVTFDRAVVTHKLIETGMPEDEARATQTMNLEDVKKLTTRRRRTERVDEDKAHRERYVGLQPTLDESAWTLTGRLPGLMGRIVDKAISQRADELRLLPLGDQATRAQRQADALVAIMQDSLGPSAVDEVSAGSGSGHVTVFVDARDPATSDGHTHLSGATGAAATAPLVTIPFGPQVGPSVLTEMLCGATVRVVGMDGDRPIASTHATRAIPPATRDAVLLRDDGCVVDGCSSRYRLEPHHVVPWAESKDHSMDNLETLCWYHHHVAIHGDGYAIDPASPVGRRRLTKDRDHDAPW